MEEALGIAEIRHHIGTYIPRKYLALCVRVCKDWQATFEPLFWQSVPVLRQDNGLLPEPAAVQHHARYLHMLRYVLPTSIEYIPMNCPQLRRLSISGGDNEVADEFWQRMADGPLQSPSLEVLRMVYMDVRWTSNPLTVALVSPSIQIKELMALRVRIREPRLFWRICANKIKILHLVSCEFRDGLLVSLKESLERMSPMLDLESVVLSRVDGMDSSDQLAFLFYCPNLTSLSWYKRVGQDFPATQLCDRISASSWPWPNLKDLKVSNMGETLSDQVMTQILTASARGFETLNASWTGFGMASVRALERHHHRAIRMLDLTGCDGLASQGFQIILSSCSHLKSLRGGTIHGEDIVAGRPWVCIEMETLVLNITLPKREVTTGGLYTTSDIEIGDMENEYENGLDQSVFLQIARLTRLETLQVAVDGIGDERSIRDDRRALSMKLNHGMKALSALSRLETLHTAHTLEQEESEWAKTHWIRMKRIVACSKS